MGKLAPSPLGKDSVFQTRTPWFCHLLVGWSDVVTGTKGTGLSFTLAPVPGLTGHVHGPCHLCCLPSVSLLQLHYLVPSLRWHTAFCSVSLYKSGYQEQSCQIPVQPQMLVPPLRRPSKHPSSSHPVLFTPSWDFSLEGKWLLPLSPSSSPSSSRRGGVGIPSPSLAGHPPNFPSFLCEPVLQGSTQKQPGHPPFSVEGPLWSKPIRWDSWKRATTQNDNDENPLLYYPMTTMRVMGQ